jgi:DNA processing protein
MGEGPATVLASGDANYPPGLLDLDDPPATLYVRGHLPAGRRVAVVGSRAATPYGLERAGRLAADVAGAGLAIVSGLARGIDTAAHRGALNAGGVTVAVLPGGLDVPTPPSNAALAEEIARRGALVSERPPGTGAHPGLFLKRNRLIAALAGAVVIVEAAERSGALSTAAAARRIGRPVLAVPGDVDRPSSRGCHTLLRAGARVCEGLADVLDCLGPRDTTAAPAAGEGLGGLLLAQLADGPAGAEALADRAGAGLTEVLTALLALEWSGAVVALPGQRWARRRGGTAS